MRRLLRLLVGLLACGALAYSVHEMVTFGSEATASTRLNRALAQQVLSIPAQTAPAAGEDAPLPGEDVPPRETAPIQVDFSQLRQDFPDVIGWLYCPDTPLNLPLVQAADNDYYLRRLPDGTPNNSGSLFADARCLSDFSEFNTVIYGHNMRNGTMFGSLKKYESQDYFETHRDLWLLTPRGDFRLEPVAGFITSSTSEFYALPETGPEMQALVTQAMALSKFSTAQLPAPNDRYLTLSTCSYEFDEARFVLLTRLVPLSQEISDAGI